MSDNAYGETEVRTKNLRENCAEAVRKRSYARVRVRA